MYISRHAYTYAYHNTHAHMHTHEEASTVGACLNQTMCLNEEMTAVNESLNIYIVNRICMLVTCMGYTLLCTYSS